MTDRSTTRGKSKLLAALLAFILPGAGHIFTGQHAMGLLLMLACLMDVGMIVWLANSEGGRHLVLIVYLIMLLPVIYYMSVYSSLQSVEQSAERRSGVTVLQASGFIAGGIVLLFLVQKPSFAEPWMHTVADWLPGLAWIACGILAIWPWGVFRKGAVRRPRAGRLTAGLLAIITGTLLLADKLQARQEILLLADWWPLFIILLGVECLVVGFLARRSSKQLRLDMLGLAVSVLISGTAFAVTKYSDFPARWLDEFNVNISEISAFDEDTGYRYDKPVLRVPLDEALEIIAITNVNGHVTVHTGNVQEAVVYTEVWVDSENEAEAAAIAERSLVQITPGAELQLEAKGGVYGGSGERRARMNIEIILPNIMSYEEKEDEGQEVEGSQESNVTGDSRESADVEQLKENTDVDEATPSPEVNIPAPPAPRLQMRIDVGLGTVYAHNLMLEGGLTIRSSSGVIKAERINGPVDIKSKNGGIEAIGISGAVSLEAKNGSIIASQLRRELFAVTLNGDLDIAEVNGSIQAETRNGGIRIVDPGNSVKADTLNGDIRLSSAVVEGDWDIGSSIGEIEVLMPSSGDYRLYGSVTFGEIESELPFEISQKTVKALSGSGLHRIQINANNSIVIKEHELSARSAFIDKI